MSARRGRDDRDQRPVRGEGPGGGAPDDVRPDARRRRVADRRAARGAAAVAVGRRPGVPQLRRLLLQPLVRDARARSADGPGHRPRPGDDPRAAPRRRPERLAAARRAHRLPRGRAPQHRRRADRGGRRPGRPHRERPAGRRQTRQALSQQIVWTLRQLPDVQAVEITAGGQPLLVPGAPSPQPRDAWPAVDPTACRPARPATRPAPTAPCGSSPTACARCPAVPGRARSPSSTSRSRTTRSRSPASIPTGACGRRACSRARRSSGSARPGRPTGLAFDRSSSVWVVDAEDGLISVTGDGTSEAITVTGLSRRTTLIAAIPSRDGTRAALIVRRGPRTGLLLARVIRTAGQPTPHRRRRADPDRVAAGRGRRRGLVGRRHAVGARQRERGHAAGVRRRHRPRRRRHRSGRPRLPSPWPRRRACPPWSARPTASSTSSPPGRGPSGCAGRRRRTRASPGHGGDARDADARAREGADGLAHGGAGGQHVVDDHARGRPVPHAPSYREGPVDQLPTLVAGEVLQRPVGGGGGEPRPDEDGPAPGVERAAAAR